MAVRYRPMRPNDAKECVEIVAAHPFMVRDMEAVPRTCEPSGLAFWVAKPFAPSYSRMAKTRRFESWELVSARSFRTTFFSN